MSTAGAFLCGMPPLLRQHPTGKGPLGSRTVGRARHKGSVRRLERLRWLEHASLSLWLSFAIFVMMAAAFVLALFRA